MAALLGRHFYSEFGSCRPGHYNLTYRSHQFLKQETARDPSHAKPKLQITHLPFSSIPGQSKLFLEYLDGPESLKEFYPNAVASVEELSSFAGTVLSEYKTDRNELCDALTDINKGIGAGEATLRNIGRLRESDCVAVVTGQQAGLFSGPLYTIYKALSAIKAAEDLSLGGTNAVPVFWAATEDHDFDEVAEASFVRSDGGLLQQKYLPESYVQDVPVGEVTIDGNIEAAIDELFTAMPQTEFSPEARDILFRSWKDGAKFGGAFLRTLAELLGRYGLIFLDPQDPGLKELSSAICVGAAGRSDEIVSALLQRDVQLRDKGFHSQVLIEENYFPLFWIDGKGRRSSLKRVGEGKFRAKGSGQEFTRDEIVADVSQSPERFSPGVMLRPVVQDFLLPTICYFGGGAEIAYFAQNSEVYRVLNRPVTPIFHRQSFTIVEAKQRRVLEKLGIDLVQLFEIKDDTLLSLAATKVSPETAELFTDVEKKVSLEIDRLERSIADIDGTLSANFVKRRRKMLYHVSVLRKKALLAAVNRDEIAGRQLSSTFNSLMPNGILQERSMNVFTFVNKFGVKFIDWIYDAIDLKDKGHRIIDL